MVLFDSSAIHSLVSPFFALCLDMRFDVLNSLLTVLTLVGEVYLIIWFLFGCEVCIDEILLVDLVELRECLNDGVMFSISKAGGMIAHVQVRSSLVEEVKQLQYDGDFCKGKIGQVRHGLNEELRVDDDGILWLQDRLVVSVAGDIRRRLLETANRSSYTMHFSSTKMYHDLRMHYWWKGMKKDVADFVVKCLTCQQVKVEHQRSAGTL